MSVSGLKKVLSHFQRRRRPLEQQEWWNHLNYAQKFAVSSLDKYGYEILFVRKDAGESLVVMSLDEAMVTVDHEGNIDMEPDIKYRR